MRARAVKVLSTARFWVFVPIVSYDLLVGALVVLQVYIITSWCPRRCPDFYYYS